MQEIPQKKILGGRIKKLIQENSYAQTHIGDMLNLSGIIVSD